MAVIGQRGEQVAVIGDAVAVAGRRLRANTKATLLMALLRAVGIRCRFYGFTIHKDLQRGVVPKAVYPLAPDEILHSWVEVALAGRWVSL